MTASTAGKVWAAAPPTSKGCRSAVPGPPRLLATGACQAEVAQRFVEGPARS
jgi:hypothetical protein